MNLSLFQLDASKDTPAALARLDKACTGGSALACGVLGHVYLKPDPVGGARCSRARRPCSSVPASSGTDVAAVSTPGCSAWAMTFAPDPDEAQRFYERGCRLGSSDACFLGGLRFSRDQPEQAISWFERACNIGHADACGQLGAHYQAGLGVPKDDARARSSLHRQLPPRPTRLLRRAPTQRARAPASLQRASDLPCRSLPPRHPRSLRGARKLGGPPPRGPCEPR